MEGINPGTLPLWVQVFVALITAIAGAYAIMKGYKGGVQLPAPTPNSQMLQLVGGSLADKFSVQALIDAIDRIVDELQQSRKETRRFREAFEAHTELVVSEHARLREEAAEIRRRLVSAVQPHHGEEK